MQKIFNPYSSREELDRAIDEAVEKTTDDAGNDVFRLRNRDAEEYLAKLNEAERRVDVEIKRREELEKKCKALVEERVETTDDGELRASVKRYAERAAANAAKVAALEAEIKPLREEIAIRKERENRATVEAQIVDAARKLDCCESALRDAKRLAPMFKLDDAGVASTRDGRSVEDALKEELALSPHWLNRSKGAAASAGTVDDVGTTSRERFQRALEGTNFADVLNFAPRQKVERFR